jgi:ferric iron reductase protein FhuF
VACVIIHMRFEPTGQQLRSAAPLLAVVRMKLYIHVAGYERLSTGLAALAALLSQCYSKLVLGKLMQCLARVNTAIDSKHTGIQVEAWRRTRFDWLHVAEQKVNLPLLRVGDILTVFIPAALVPSLPASTLLACFHFHAIANLKP